MPHLERRTLYSGSLVRLIDVRCRESSRACSGEERAAAHQLVVIRAGVFLKHAPTSSRRELVAEPMHALLLNREERFRISHPAAGGDDCTVFEFTPEAVGEVVAELDPGVQDRRDPFAISHAPFASRSRLELHRLRASLAAGADALGHEERLLVLLGSVLTDGYRAHGRALRPRREATRSARRELVERTRHALAVAPAAPWSLAALAREVGSSPYHLTRVFQAATGLPVHQYLLRLRLALALEQLGDGDGRLGAIALDAGFASHSHFTTVFRKTYGVLPGALTRARGASRH